MKVSIVICAFNEKAHIGKLLHGIERQVCEGPREVIVVDSGSTDSTVTITKKFGARIVRIPPGDRRRVDYGTTPSGRSPGWD